MAEAGTSAAVPDGSPAGRTFVGLISDTHGHLDERVMRVFSALAEQGSLAAIVHAGDVGSDPGVLWELGALAPVTAVLGNCDHPLPSLDLAAVARTTVAGVRILVIHDFADLGQIPEGTDVVVRGHSHIPSVQHRGDVLVVNPGSASQRRRQPSRSVAVLEIGDGAPPAARIVMLDGVES